MTKATMADLQRMQKLMVDGLTKRMEQDIEDNIPTDAATYGVVTKLLKDNDVRVEAADVDDLQGLREQLAEKQRERKLKASSALALVKQDMKEACG